MATSGALNTSSYDGRYYRLEWSASQSIANNTSTISWTLKSVGGNDSWYAERTLQVVIAGTTVVNKTDRVQRYAGTIASGTKVISHDANGNASFSASIQAAVYYSSVNCTGSDTFTLDTIPRASAFGTITGNTIGSNVTVNITRYSSSFTHQLWYKVGNSEWYDLGKGIGTSKTFPIDMETCWQAINATSVLMKLCIRTFNGTTQIGSDVYKDVTVYVPASVIPSVSFEVTEAEGYFARFGSYIQGKSKLQVNINASGAYGSTIKSYNASFDGKVYTGETFTTDAIVNGGELDLIVTVTDSRGRTASITEKVRVLAYVPPQITSLIIKRTNANGISSSNGAYLTAIFDAKVTKLDENVSVGYRQNEAVIKAKYLNKVDSSDTNETTILLDAFDVQGGTYTFPANPSSSYEFTLIVDDFFTQQSNTPTTKTVVGGTARKTFSVLRRGLGFAFNKVAELEDFLDVNFKTLFRKFIVLKNMVSIMMENAEGEYRDVMHMTATNNLKIGYDSYDKEEGSTDVVGNDVNVMFRNGMWINGQPFVDFVVEEGESNGWFYRKWNNGNAECWKIYYGSGVNAAANNYNGFYYSNSISVAYPFSFVNLPTVNVDGGSLSHMNFCRVFGSSMNNANFIVVGLSNVTSTDITVYIRATGKWK